jgi:hypothetical protein
MRLFSSTVRCNGQRVVALTARRASVINSVCKVSGLALPSQSPHGAPRLVDSDQRHGAGVRRPNGLILRRKGV